MVRVKSDRRRFSHGQSGISSEPMGGEVVVVSGIKRGLLAWVEQNQHTMGGCRNSGCCRTDSERGRVGIVIGLIPAFNRLNRVMHGGLDKRDIQQSWRAGTTHRNRRR